MKKDQLIYRISTGLLVVLMLLSAYTYFTSTDIKAAFAHLGFPDYFRVQLGVAKAIGAVLLTIPVVPAKLKEFVYAGFGITFTSAFIAHMASGDSASVAVPPLLFAVVLAVSYVYFHKLNKRLITNAAI